MPKSGGKKKRGVFARRWLLLPLLLAIVGLFAAGGTLAYAVHLENNDGFCASCHTQPEADYYSRSQAPPVDLAAAHATQSVTCIDCHSGRGAIGRLTAMTSVALPDLLAYQTGHFRSPATTTIPDGDDHCLKCHARVLAGADFNNHFHAFLPMWQSRAPHDAATCVECHVSHASGGDAKLGFLVESTTVAVCQRCHAFAGD